MAEVKEENPYLKMTQAQKKKHRAWIDFADEAEGAALDVAAAVALKWALSRLKDRKKLGTVFDGVAVQALPKETYLGKVADLSETQIDNIKKTVISALEKIAI